MVVVVVVEADRHTLDNRGIGEAVVVVLEVLDISHPSGNTEVLHHTVTKVNQEVLTVHRLAVLTTNTLLLPLLRLTAPEEGDLFSEEVAGLISGSPSVHL